MFRQEIQFLCRVLNGACIVLNGKPTHCIESMLHDTTMHQVFHTHQKEIKCLAEIQCAARLNGVSYSSRPVKETNLINKFYFRL